jgi:hypothetical protein
MDKEKENAYLKEVENNKSKGQLNEKTEVQGKQEVRKEKAEGIDSWEGTTPT